MFREPAFPQVRYVVWMGDKSVTVESDNPRAAIKTARELHREEEITGINEANYGNQERPPLTNGI